MLALLLLSKESARSSTNETITVLHIRAFSSPFGLPKRAYCNIGDSHVATMLLQAGYALSMSNLLALAGWLAAFRLLSATSFGWLLLRHRRMWTE